MDKIDELFGDVITYASICSFWRSFSSQARVKLHGMALDFDGAGFIRTNRPPSKVGAGVYGTTKHSEVDSTFLNSFMTTNFFK